MLFLQSALFLHGFQRTAKGDASVAVGQAALQVLRRRARA